MTLQESVNPLKKLQWKNRIILIVTDDFLNKKYRKQVTELLRNIKGLDDRRLVVLGVGKTAVIREFGSVAVSALNTESLRSFYDLPTGKNQLVLVGKDGGIKSRWHDIATRQSIFALIDSMPMRRAEMRDK